MDTLSICSLKVDTIIGVNEWERHVKQTVHLDLDIAYDNRIPAASDNINDALDYDTLAKHLTAFISSSRYQLIETLAERCAEHIQNEFHIPWLRVRLSKPSALPNGKNVSITIERGEKSTWPM